MSFAPAVTPSIPDQSATGHRLSRLPQHDYGATFLMLLIEAIQTGTVVIDDGAKIQPNGIIVAHWLAGWEALPLYPSESYGVVQQLAATRGLPLGSPEQVWSELEQAGLLTRAWNGQPLTVRWRGVDRDAFIIPLVALSFTQS